MSMFGAMGTICFKRASGTSSICELLKEANLYFGCALYFLAALINIYVLKYLDYSVVMPLTSLTYIWTLLFSKVLLNEKITSKKIAGIIFIIIGASLIALN